MTCRVAPCRMLLRHMIRLIANGSFILAAPSDGFVMSVHLLALLQVVSSQSSPQLVWEMLVHPRAFLDTRVKLPDC